MESLISLVERLSFIMEDEVRRKKASCTEGKRKTEAGDITRR